MARIYDNWERLVTATLRREQLRLSGQRTPSDISSASLSSFSFNSSSGRVSSFNFSSSFIGGSFTHHQILKATDHLSDSNLIKHGHSGELFYGVLEGGAEIVVKKIDLSLPERESYFISEFEFLGKVSHPRLIPLLGHCLEHGNEKFLVYKYMPNKDLSTSLFWELDADFDSDGDDSLRFSSLDWVTRLKIAIGVAEGLCYLHHECVPPLVHRDIQASSILLDENFEVRLGSFTELCTAAGKDSNQNRIARFLRLPRASAPGTSGTSNATFAYDVYCFGKILLQLITGKLNLTVLLELVTRKLRLSDSIDNPRAKLDTLQGTNDPEEDWIENTLPYISMFDNRNLVLNIVDPSLMIDDDLVMEVWAVSIIAKACLNPKPSRRPRMAYVLKALKNPFQMVTKEETVWGWLSTPNDPQPAVPPGSVSPVMENRMVPEAAFRPPELELEFY